MNMSEQDVKSALLLRPNGVRIGRRGRGDSRVLVSSLRVRKKRKKGGGKKEGGWKTTA